MNQGKFPRKLQAYDGNISTCVSVKGAHLPSDHHRRYTRPFSILGEGYAADIEGPAIPHSALSDIEVSAFLDQIHSKAHTQQFTPHTLLSSTESAETTYFIMGLLHIAECKTTNTHPIWNELPTLYLSNQALRLRHFSLAQKTKVLFEKSVHTQTKQTPFETPGSILTKFISQIHISAQELFSLLHKKTLSNIALRALSFSGQEPIITVESTEDADLIALLATDDNPNISNSVSRTLRKEACSTHHEEYLGKSKTSHAVQIF